MDHVMGGRVLPVVLKGAGLNYRLLECAGRTLYFQFNRAQDGEGETLAAFGERLVGKVTAQAPVKLIIDLRFNTGGDATKAHQFLKALTAMAWTRERGRVVAMIGPNTFSAGITHAVWLKQESAATFVGAPNQATSSTHGRKAATSIFPIRNCGCTMPTWRIVIRIGLSMFQSIKCSSIGTSTT